MTVASMQAEARKNRARLLEVAYRLIAEEGLAFSVRKLAAEAGVGVGTLYRNFPTRDDLVDAVLGGVFDELAAKGNALLHARTGWEGLEQFFELFLEMSARSRGLRAVWADVQQERVAASVEAAGIWETLERLVERAKAEGTLRPDFVVEDVALIYWGCDRVLELAGTAAPDLWRRQLAFLKEGIHTGPPSTIPHPPLGRRQTIPLAQKPPADAAS